MEVGKIKIIKTKKNKQKFIKNELSDTYVIEYFVWGEKRWNARQSGRKQKNL